MDVLKNNTDSKLLNALNYFHPSYNLEDLFQLNAVLSKIGYNNIDILADWLSNHSIDDLYFSPPCPDGEKYKLKEIEDINIRLSDKLELISIPCSNQECKSTNTTAEEMQTRGADEGASVLVTCFSCGRRSRVA